MAKAPRLFGTNGIRGVAGKEIDSVIAFRVGSALGTLFPKHRVLIGRDGRLSSRMLLEGVAAGLLARGNHVEDLGLITTPALEFLVRKASSSAGVMVTASHNPPEYNGVKVVDSYGIEIDRAKEEKMELLIHRVQLPATYSPGQRTSREGEIRSYLHEVEKHVVHKDRVRDLKIVVDTGNGGAAQTTPTLLRDLGARVISVNDVFFVVFTVRIWKLRPDTLALLPILLG